MAGPAAAEVRSLFRQFLRLGRNFPSYNVRHYIQRRAKEGFHAAGTEPDASKALAAWEMAKQELQTFQRQSLVYGLYGRKMKNVLEVDAAKAGRH